ncbi:MAG: tetratricopeptide repeat protein [Ignavibacteria bacterium]|nr:tetratricopeptide repeat protein [Ignavibacteria bacterium]
MSRSQTRHLLLTELLSGTKPVVFLTGEAGMGKSTMLRGLKEEIARDHTAVRIADVDCSSPLAGINVGAVEALYPWIQMMRELAEEAPNTQTKKLVTDLARAWIKFIPIVGDLIESTVDTVSIVKEHRAASAPSEPATSREHVFHQCIGFFRALAEKGRVVLIIDDAHWADDSSLNLLFALARASAGNMTCVLAYRQDDVRTSRDGSEHELLHIRRELERYDLCTEIELPPMSGDELLELVGSADVSADALVRYSGGNPFFALGYTHRDINDASRASIDAVIAEKLSRLDPEQRDLLSMAAIEGETFTSLVLRSISPLPPLQIAQVLRRAENEHMLVRSEGKTIVYGTETPTYTFVNEAVQHALAERIGDEEREILHASIAEVLRAERDVAAEEGVDAHSLLTKLAVHTELGGNKIEAMRTWIQVAERAWRMYAEQEARSAIAQVLRISTSGVVSREMKRVRGQTLGLLGMIEQFVRDVPKTISCFDEAIELGRSADDPELEVTSLCRRAAAANMSGDPDGVQRYANEALRLSESHHNVVGELAAISMLGMWHESNRDLDGAEVCFERSLALAKHVGHSDRVANALVNIGRIKVHRDEYGSSIPYFLEAASAYEALQRWDGMARALNNAGIAYADLGQLDEAAEIYGRALELHERIADVVGGSSLKTNLAQLHMRRGDLDAAEVLIEQSIAAKRSLDDGYGLAIALYTRGLIAAERNDKPSALKWLLEARSIAETVQEQLVIDEINSAISTIAH